MDILTSSPHPFPSEVNAAGCSRLKAFAREFGITIETLNIPSGEINLCIVSRDMRQFAVDHICWTLELASDPQAPIETTGPGRSFNFNAPEASKTTEWLTACVEQLFPSAEKVGGTILLELHAFSCLPSTDALSSFVESLHAKQLGIALDYRASPIRAMIPPRQTSKLPPGCGKSTSRIRQAGKWRHHVIGRFGFRRDYGRGPGHSLRGKQHRGDHGGRPLVRLFHIQKSAPRGRLAGVKTNQLKAKN